MFDRDSPMDPVFKALADPTRRRILDLLRADSGLTVGEVSDRFEVTRYAVMKHLKVLEEANLVVSRRDGRSKRLYLNAVPIQMIHDRWLSRYSARFAAGLTALAWDLEDSDPPTQPENHTMSDTKPTQVYVTYIRTTPEKLWAAITDPDKTAQYFHGSRIDLHGHGEGDTVRWLLDKDGEDVVAIDGKVLAWEPHKRFAHTFVFPPNGDPPSRCTWELEPMGHLVKLTVTHEFDQRDATFESTSNGWPPVFSGLKTLLETGEPLGIPDLM